MKKRFPTYILYILIISKSTSKFGICQKEDKFCLSCDENSKCLLCVNSLLKSDGTCQHITNQIPNCLIYDPEKSTETNLICKECIKGYKIIHNQCIKIQSEFCLQILQDSTIETQNSISIISEKKVNGNKFQEKQNLFQTISTSIASHGNTTETCIICEQNMLPHFGKCKNISFCSVQNCEHCFNTGLKEQKCLECQKGFTLQKMWNDTNYCVLITKNTKNCLYMEMNLETNKEYCAICKVNFYNFEGNCLKSDLYELVDYDKEIDILNNAKVMVGQVLVFLLIYFSFDF
jgi:hypothetical protein